MDNLELLKIANEEIENLKCEIEKLKKENDMLREFKKERE